MADAINTGNPVPNSKFIVNDYEDIKGSRVSQETPRGRLCFEDTDGRMTLPRTVAEADKAVFPVDWPKPLNPPPYFEGPGLNGTAPYAFNDGSLDEQENHFALDPDQVYQGSWPQGYKVWDIPPMFFDLPVTSGNKCLVWDEGYFTYGSGNYVAPLSSYTLGAKVYVAYDSGSEGKITYAASGVTTAVGTVYKKEVFGTETLTVRLKGSAAL